MEAIIEVDRLHKRYGEVVAVDGLSLAVAEGEVLGVAGPNGAGKTTTVESIAGLRAPDSGTIRVAGLDPIADRDALRQLLGIQLQEARLPDQLRVGEALELYASFHHHPADPMALVRELGLEHAWATPFQDLSGGQQQRLSVALALVGRPRIAILDELTTGLDPQARRDTWELVEAIRASRVTIVLVSHSMEELERLCDRVVVIDHGRVVGEGTPSRLVAEVLGTTRVVLQTADELDPALLAEVAGTRASSREGRNWIVSGDGDLATRLREVLERRGIGWTQLRTELPTLDHAYLTLTGTSTRRRDREEAHR